MTDRVPIDATADSGAWLFDVDGCLVDSLTGKSLRPLAAAVLGAVRAARRPVVLWSAGGDHHARAIADRLGFAGLVDAYYDKSERGTDRRWLVNHLDAGHHPAVCVDDRPEEVPADVTVLAVHPYIAPDPYDVGLSRVLSAAQALLERS